MYEAKAHISTPIGSERSFAVVFTVVFCLLGFHPLLNGGSPRSWLLIASGVTLVIGIAAPHLLAVPNRLWYRFGLTIGTVVSQIVMAVIFILVVTPTGIVLRVFRRTATGNRTASAVATTTYWIPRGSDSNPLGSLRNQY